MRMQSDALVELLAREHRTVEGLLDELAALDGTEASDLFGVIQLYGTMSKAALVQALCDRR
jgi:hypothetical protein